jgi:hypothetical protein
MLCLTNGPTTAHCTRSQANDCHAVPTTGLFGKNSYSVHLPNVCLVIEVVFQQVVYLASRHRLSPPHTRTHAHTHSHKLLVCLPSTDKLWERKNKSERRKSTNISHSSDRWWETDKCIVPTTWRVSTSGTCSSCTGGVAAALSSHVLYIVASVER